MRLLLFAALIFGAAFPLDAATPKLVTATYLGTASDDDLQDVAVAKDGTIYVVGDLDRLLRELPGDVETRKLGSPEESWYRCGFVAVLSPDAGKLVRCLQFARGQVFLTSVALGDAGIYIGGYAVPEFARAIKPFEGLFGDAQKANGVPLPNPLPGAPQLPAASLPSRAERDASGGLETLTIKTRHHGDKRGVPIVMRLRDDLSGIAAGTFLEGHHYAWNIAMPSYEEEWTPVGMEVLSGGDLIVLHDGGAPVHHYYAPDYVSRLSADLQRRAWRFDVFHPEIKTIEKIRQRREGFQNWKFPVLGHIRTLRARGDGAGGFYVGGWSVSMTSRESWWCPFLWKLNDRGKVVWKAYTFDPMGGSGGRMGGLVSDSAIRSVAADDAGNLYVAGISDGGNTVLRRDPHDYAKPGVKFRRAYAGMKGRELYVGHLMRLSAETADVQAGTMLGSYAQQGYEPAWVVDVAPLAGHRVLAVGRHNRNYPATDDAWFKASGHRGMFLKVLTADMEELFSANVPDAVPYAVARRGDRCVIVGMAESGASPIKVPLVGKHAGGLDAYLMVVDLPQ